MGHKICLNVVAEILDEKENIVKSHNISSSLGKDDKVKICVKDEDNKIIEQKSFLMDSFVHQWHGWIYTHLNYITRGQQVETDGSVSTMANTAAWFVDANAADADYGIIVGSGLTLVANDDYNMADKIDHGVAATELDYGASAIEAPVVSGSSMGLQFHRTFTNSSGNPLSISEYGLVASTNSARFFMMARDLSTPVEVPNAGSAEVAYFLNISESSGFTQTYLENVYNRMLNSFITGIQFTNTSGVEISGTELETIFNAKGGEGEDNFGIVVGSGIGAIDWTDYALDDQAMHGVAANEIRYLDNYTFGSSYSGGEITTEIHRIFTNSSGNTIVLKEVGLYCGGTQPQKWMMFRALTGDITLLDNQSVRIRLLYKTSV